MAPYRHRSFTKYNLKKNFRNNGTREGASEIRAFFDEMINIWLKFFGNFGHHDHKIQSYKAEKNFSWARISPCVHLAGLRLRFLFISNFSILKNSRRIPVLSPHCTGVNYQLFQFSELQTTKDRKVEFFVCSCFDVFFEELSFGNRRQLAKLESIGRRFRVVIDQKFRMAPFLRLNLTWYSISHICKKCNLLPARSQNFLTGVLVFSLNVCFYCYNAIRSVILLR